MSDTSWELLADGKVIARNLTNDEAMEKLEQLQPEHPGVFYEVTETGS